MIVGRTPALCAALAISALLLAPNSGRAEAYADAYKSYRAAIKEKDLEKALIYARKAHQAAQLELELEDAQRGVLAYNLGAVSHRVRRYRDALPPLQEAATRYAAAYGPESEKNLAPLRQLARTYQALGNWHEAERQWVRAISIVEAHRGRTAQGVTEILMALSEVAHQLDAPKRMRSYSQRALYNLYQGSDPTSLEVGHAHINLAKASILLGDASETNKNLDRAIAIYEIHLPRDSPELIDLYAFAAEAFEKTGRSTAARKYRRKVKEARG